MESSSYEGMSGTNAINTAAVLLETGMVEMVEPVTTLVLEAPAGLVRVSADCADGRVERITFENVPSFCTALDAVVEVPGLGSREGRPGLRRRVVRVRRRDARWASRSCPTRRATLGELGERIRPHVAEQLSIVHPLEDALAYLSFVVFVAPPRVGGDARHATIVSPGRLDRAPTGTATSARIAVLEARGEMGDDVRRRERDRHDLQRPDRAAARRSARSTPSSPRSPAAPGSRASTNSSSTRPTRLSAGFKLPDTWGPGAREGTLNP